MKKTITIALLLGFTTVAAQAASIAWGSGDFRFRGEDTLLMPVGAMVQLVYAGADGVVGLGTDLGHFSSDIDMDNAPGAYVAGDDLVIMTLFIGDGAAGKKGQAMGSHGYTWGAVTDANSNIFTTGAQFFLRIWDNADPASAENYNQTGMFSIAAVDNSGVDTFTLQSDLTTTQPVPEPGTLMLALAGAGAFLAKRRKTKKSA